MTVHRAFDGAENRQNKIGKTKFTAR